MKKFLIIILSSILLTLSFVGCTNDTTDNLPRSNNLPDFADCEIGYKLEVYPKVPFDYELPDETIVHIDSIEATLTAKNEINEGDTIKEYFYPYEVTVKVVGNTSVELAGKKINISLNQAPAGLSIDISNTISQNGDILIEANGVARNNCTLFFLWIYID